MTDLFSPLTLRGTTFRNRVWASPMCQYSAVDGLPQAWHLPHLGALAVGGSSLVFTEATAVTPNGRISPADTGIWNDAQVAAWRPITDFIKSQDAVPGIQLAHAGRKASTAAPWLDQGYVPVSEGGWEDVVAPSPLVFGDYATPRAMTAAEISQTVTAFRDGALRALDAGFEVAEIHAAHGYLLHTFLSPLSNQRTDEYGGGFESRIRFPLEVVDAVRAVWPQDKPLVVRLSATDWTPGGWDADQTVELARRLADRGVDLVDCSSGGAALRADIPVAPGYQVPFAEKVRSETGVPTGAVGMITEPAQADAIIRNGQADVVLLARALLRNPHWPQHAAHELGAEVRWPQQYERAQL